MAAQKIAWSGVAVWALWGALASATESIQPTIDLDSVRVASELTGKHYAVARDAYALDDAAAAALWSLRGADREHLGLIYEQDGLRQTEPVVSESSRRARGKFAIPAGSLRAIFHNHPDGRGKSNSRFSPKDVEQAHTLGVPSYITADGELRRYTPGTSVPDSFAFQRGEPVLAQLPIDTIRRDMMIRILKRDPNDPRGLYR